MEKITEKFIINLVNNESLWMAFEQKSDLIKAEPQGDELGSDMWHVLEWGKTDGRQTLWSVLQ